MQTTKPAAERVIFWVILVGLLALWPLSTILPGLSPEITPKQKQVATLERDGAQVQQVGAGDARELRVDFSKTKADDNTVRDLGGLDVNVLNLAYANVSDAGLAPLEGMPHLRVLDLSYTPVTDASLDRLSGLKDLRTLNLSGTRVTDEGVARLKAARPNLEIRR